MIGYQIGRKLESNLLKKKGREGVIDNVVAIFVLCKHSLWQYYADCVVVPRKLI